MAQQLFEFKIVHFGAKTVILTEVKISHMKTGREFSLILDVFLINPNTIFERKQRALDGRLIDWTWVIKSNWIDLLNWIWVRPIDAVSVCIWLYWTQTYELLHFKPNPRFSFTTDWRCTELQESKKEIGIPSNHQMIIITQLQFLANVYLQ